MKYNIEALFAFMDAEKPVKVTADDGQIFTGHCWAYSSVQNEEEDGVAEDSLTIGPIGKGPHVTLYASEIEKIEFID